MTIQCPDYDTVEVFLSVKKNVEELFKARAETIQDDQILITLYYQKFDQLLLWDSNKQQYQFRDGVTWNQWRYRTKEETITRASRKLREAENSPYKRSEKRVMFNTIKEQAYRRFFGSGGSNYWED